MTEILDLVLNALRDDSGGLVENAEIVEGEVLVTFDGENYAIRVEAL